MNDYFTSDIFIGAIENHNEKDIWLSLKKKLIYIMILLIIVIMVDQIHLYVLEKEH